MILKSPSANKQKSNTSFPLGCPRPPAARFAQVAGGNSKRASTRRGRWARRRLGGTPSTRRSPVRSPRPTRAPRGLTPTPAPPLPGRSPGAPRALAALPPRRALRPEST